ncbi:MAG: helix-turn-helix domain-containing protein [Streptosporangiaceae bacterium]
MRNERLRALLLERGETIDKLADALAVDRKTVERWITTGRIPYRKHRFGVAAFFGVDESYIWPDALDRDEVAAVSQSEVVTVWPHRWAVPRDTWGHFFSQAEREIGALVYSGMFMAEDIGVHRLFASRARAGVRVRLLLGDPDSRNVAERGATEGIDEAMAAKVRSSIVLFGKLLAEPGVELRLHGTVLYNSIYRADDQLLVNTHIYGVMANNAPVFHLRKIPGGEMASTYIDSFERVWDEATPCERPQRS